MNTFLTTTTRALVALGVAALLALGATSAASAAPTYKPFTVDVRGGGLWTVDAEGDVVVNGPAQVLDWHSGELQAASLTATLAPGGGSLPDPETCKPASATFIVAGDRDATLTLVGTGTVCAVVVPIAPWIVTQQFEGRYQITEAGRRNLRGNDGSFSMRLTQTGFASASATDVLPEN